MKPTTLRTQSISGLARVVALTLLVACGQAAPQQPAARPPTAAPAPASGAAAAPPASAPQPSSEGDWRSTWERTLEAAKQEGRVVVYSTPSAGHRNGLLKFQEAYPDISLELSSFTTAEFEARAQREREAGINTFDVYVAGISSTVFSRQIPGGWYAPLKPALILPEALDDNQWGLGPSGRSGFDAGFLDEAKQYAYAFCWNASANVFINAEQVPEGTMKTPADLLDPRWRGKIAWLDPRLRQAGSSTLAALMQDLDDDAVRRLLVDQQPVISRDGRQIAEWVVRGRYPIGIGVNDSDVEQFRAQGIGQKVRSIDLAVTGSPATGGLMLLNGGPHPNAAKVYVNWLLTQKAQADWAQSAKSNSRRVDVPPGDPDGMPDPNKQYFSPNTEQNGPKRERALALAEQYLR